MLPFSRQVGHLPSFPAHGHSSSCLSCLASPALLLGLALPWHGAVLSAGLSPSSGPSRIHRAPPHGATHLSSCRDNGFFVSIAPSFIIWLWEWKIPLNTLLHGSCKGRNYYKMPEGEPGGRTSPSSAWSAFALTRCSWSTTFCSKSSSYGETVLVPCTGWRSVFPQVPWDRLHLSQSWAAEARLDRGRASAE